MARSIEQLEIGKELESLFETCRLHRYLESLGDFELPETTKKIIAAVQRLDSMARQIITLKYLEEDGVFHSTVYRKLGISPMTYDEVRYKAFAKLGMALGLTEVKKHTIAL